MPKRQDSFFKCLTDFWDGKDWSTNIVQKVAASAKGLLDDTGQLPVSLVQPEDATTSRKTATHEL